MRSIWFAILLIGAAGCFEPPASVDQAAHIIRSGDRESGLEMLRVLLAEDPENPELLFIYGRALANGGQISAARWPLTNAMRHPEWKIPAGMLAAQGAYSVRGYEDAIALTTTILEDFPEHVPALLLRAEAGLDARLGYEAPLEDAERVLDVSPENEQALRLKIVALLNLEEIDEASVAMETLSAMLTRRGEAEEGALADLCAIEGTFQFEKGEIEEAREQWETCVERFPGDTRVLVPAVEFFDTLGEQARSIEILLAAAEIEASNSEILAALANRLFALDRGDEAEALLRATAEEFPAVGWGLLADYYRQSEDHRARAAALDQLIEIVPSPTPQALSFDRADAWLLAGDLERAEALAGRLGIPAEKTLLLGRVALERGEARKALDLFAETSRVWPNQTFARYYAGYAAELVGDFDRAIEEYRHAIRSGAEETNARFRLAQIYFAEGRDQTAIETLSLSGGEDSMDARKLLLRILGRNRRIEAIRQQMAPYWSVPGVRAELFEQAVAGFSEIGGAGAAAQTIEGTPIDLLDPRDSGLLRRYVTLQLNAGRPEPAAERAQRALASAPDSADFNEIAGLILEHSGREREQARRYYETALSRVPDHARSLLGLARLDFAMGQVDAGRASLDRAIVAAGADRALLLACARLLLQANDVDRAETILSDLARDEPSDSQPTMLLAGLRFERGSSDDWTLSLARSAARLGGGVPAMRLTASIHEARGETEAAASLRHRVQEAAARAAAALDEPRGGTRKPGDSGAALATPGVGG